MKNFGEYRPFFETTQFSWFPILDAITASLAQGYVTYRAWRLNNRNYLLLGVTVVRLPWPCSRSALSSSRSAARCGPRSGSKLTTRSSRRSTRAVAGVSPQLFTDPSHDRLARERHGREHYPLWGNASRPLQDMGAVGPQRRREPEPKRAG